jgi:7-cyano-7-deazaguanine synthase
MLYDLIDQRYKITSAVSFNYGQRHKKELDYAKKTAEKLGITHRVIDLHKAGFTDAIEASGSSLVSDHDVPEGHYAEDNMKQTVVPNRNMVMISIAISIAVAEEATFVATGVHAGDHAIYPDCRPEFIQAASQAGVLANKGFGSFGGIVTPYVYSSKADIAEKAFRLEVPIEETWSCYKGGKIHCGKCGTCVERLEAIDEALHRLDPKGDFELMDKTEYEDVDYWRQVVAEASA